MQRQDEWARSSTGGEKEGDPMLLDRAASASKEDVKPRSLSCGEKQSDAVYVDQVTLASKEGKLYTLEMLLRFTYGERFQQDASTENLTDPNRTSRLKEEFQNLYNEPWTNALTELLDSPLKDEEKCVQSLLTICQRSFAFVSGEFENLSKIFLDVYKPPGNKMSIESNEGIKRFLTSKVNEQIKQMPDSWKLPFFQSLCQKANTDGDTITIDSATATFTKKCVDLFWRMRTQDPPMNIEVPNIDDIFDEKKHKPYTKPGQYIKYCTWPALYLYKDGPILHKAVVEVTTEKSKPKSHTL